STRSPPLLNAPPPTPTHPLSLHDALPIYPHFIQAFQGDGSVTFSGITKEANLPVASHQDYIQYRNGKIPIDRFALRHITDALPDLFQWVPEQLYTTAGRRNQAHDGFE